VLFLVGTEEDLLAEVLIFRFAVSAQVVFILSTRLEQQGDWPKSYRSGLVFRRYWVTISTRTPANLADVFRGFFSVTPRLITRTVP
jgi:hypothetical protein